MDLGRAVPPPTTAPPTTTPPPDVVKPEATWRGDKLVLVFPDGREIPTDIARTAPQGGGAAHRGVPTSVRVGKQHLWGDIRWTIFSCDPDAASGSSGSRISGVAATKYSAVAFELFCDAEAKDPVFLSGADDEEEDDDYYEDERDRSVTSLSHGMRTGRGIKCQVREDDGLGRAVAVVTVPSDRECAIYAWLLTSPHRRRWRWTPAGSVKFVLPTDFSGSLIDAVSVERDTVVVRQPGKQGLRFELNAPVVSAEPDGVKWTYGDAVWDVAPAPADEATSLPSRMDRTLTILCRPADLPGLADAWQAVGLAAARRRCEHAGMCPVYIEVRRDSSSPGLASLLGAVVADRVLLVLNITESPDQAWLGGSEAMKEEIFDFVRSVRDIASRVPEGDFQCVLIANPQVSAAVHGVMGDYHTVRLCGPYAEMPDEDVLPHLLSGLPELEARADELLEPYRALRDHCLEKWEESFVEEEKEYDSEEPGTPFLLPAAQAQRVFQEAVKSGGDLTQRVLAELSKVGAAAREMPPEMRRRLAELPLLLRESGGEVLYGQDEPIWATQRHLQAHLLRSSEGKPTFTFYVGVNGLGKTTLAINSIRALGGAMEEVNCASLDNTYAYGERAGATILNKRIAALRASPNPLKALLLDEVDKNIDILKALIKLADSDASAARGMLDHPLAGIFVFITLNVVPDCKEHAKFVEEDDPQARMERLRDLIVASVKNVGDAKVVHAVISRLVPYTIVFNELNADGDSGRRHLLSLAEDEGRGFVREYGVRVVLDDDALDGLVRRSSAYGVGGFRSVRTFMRREIESAIGDMRAQGEWKRDTTLVLRDAGTHLSAASAEEGDTVLYAIAVTRHKRLSEAMRASVGRMLDAARMRRDDRVRLDQYGALAACLGHLTARPLFSIDGGEAKFAADDGGLIVCRAEDRDRERLLKASLAELRRKVSHHTRALLDATTPQSVDAAVQDMLSEAGRFFRLSLADDLADLSAAAPAWATAAWKSHIEFEKKSRSRAEAVKEAFRELSGEWARLAEEQEDSMSDVRKFPELRSRAAKRASEITTSFGDKAERFGLSERELESVNAMAIDGADEDAVLKEFELDADRAYEPPPMSTHLLGGVAKAFLVDRLVRDMLRSDYTVADKKQAEERFRRS